VVLPTAERKMRTLVSIGPASLRALANLLHGPPYALAKKLTVARPEHRLVQQTSVSRRASRLLSEGTDVVVESPPELVGALREKAREVATLYGKTSNGGLRQLRISGLS
jgi:hypothetical protein